MLWLFPSTLSLRLSIYPVILTLHTPAFQFFYPLISLMYFIAHSYSHCPSQDKNLSHYYITDHQVYSDIPRRQKDYFSHVLLSGYMRGLIFFPYHIIITQINLAVTSQRVKHIQTFLYDRKINYCALVSC